MKETPPKKNPEMNIYLTQYKLDGQFEWNEQVHHMALFDGKVYNVKLKDITDIIWNGQKLKMLGQQLLDLAEGRMHSSSKVSAAQSAVFIANRESKDRFKKKEANLKDWKKAFKAIK